MAAFTSLVHHTYMAKDSPGHFLRAWRKNAGLSLEEVAEQVKLLSAERSIIDPNMRPLSMTHATLSRIETGKIPYNQHLLTILATIYKTDVASLIMRDPTQTEGIWSIWDQLKPTERKQVVEIAKTIKRTGTG